MNKDFLFKFIFVLVFVILPNSICRALLKELKGINNDVKLGLEDTTPKVGRKLLGHLSIKINRNPPYIEIPTRQRVYTKYPVNKDIVIPNVITQTTTKKSTVTEPNVNNEPSLDQQTNAVDDTTPNNNQVSIDPEDDDLKPEKKIETDSAKDNANVDKDGEQGSILKNTTDSNDTNGQFDISKDDGGNFYPTGDPPRQAIWIKNNPYRTTHVPNYRTSTYNLDYDDLPAESDIQGPKKFTLIRRPDTFEPKQRVSPKRDVDKELYEEKIYNNDNYFPKIKHFYPFATPTTPPYDVLPFETRWTRRPPHNGFKTTWTPTTPPYDVLPFETRWTRRPPHNGFKTTWTPTTPPYDVLPFETKWTRRPPHNGFETTWTPTTPPYDVLPFETKWTRRPPHNGFETTWIPITVTPPYDVLPFEFDKGLYPANRPNGKRPPVGPDGQQPGWIKGPRPPKGQSGQRPGWNNRAREIPGANGRPGANGQPGWNNGGLNGQRTTIRANGQRPGWETRKRPNKLYVARSSEDSGSNVDAFENEKLMFQAKMADVKGHDYPTKCTTDRPLPKLEKGFAPHDTNEEEPGHDGGGKAGAPDDPFTILNPGLAYVPPEYPRMHKHYIDDE